MVKQFKETYLRRVFFSFITRFLKLKWMRGRVNLYPYPLPILLIFKKYIFQKKGGHLVLWDFWYYHKWLFWKFHWNSSTHSEDVNISFFSINYFHEFFGFLDISFLKKILMASEYDGWHQHFFLHSTCFK